MITLLRIVFIGILAVMTWGTVRASLAQALFDIPPEVYTNPWFQVTLFDAYFAFFTFYFWVAWKEQSVAARLLWFVAIALWGNFAMATYLLIELFRVNANDSLDRVVVSRHPGRVGLPAAFTGLGVIAYLLGTGMFSA